MDLFAGQTQDTDVPGVTYEAGFVPSAEADRLFQLAVDGIRWEQRPVVVAGVSRQQPRLVSMLGEAGVSYTYAGLTLQTAALPSYLEALMRRVSAAAGEQFNCVLANYYRDGKDSIGLHRDAEPELGPDPIIASISLGATRTFILRPTLGGTARKIPLASGSLLVMGRGVQKRWLHGIDKEPGAGPRVNFTFRRIAEPRRRP